MKLLQKFNTTFFETVYVNVFNSPFSKDNKKLIFSFMLVIFWLVTITI